ncbi:MAG: hypothetical protein L6Q99_08655 [Planctomycetes bacterium]|nr:hypothetical protein [Planctomycetota bacterium]
MRSFAVTLFVLASFVGCAAPGRSPTPSAAASVEPVTPIAELAPFAPLVGGTWSAPFNDKVHDEQCFEWVYGGKFLRNLHWVKDTTGKVVYEGETIYAFDPRERELVWWYWNATGGFIVGTAQWSGMHAEFVGENHAPGTQTERVRSTADLGDGEWTSTGWFWKDGAWVEQGKRTYRRVE